MVLSYVLQPVIVPRYMIISFVGLAILTSLAAESFKGTIFRALFALALFIVFFQNYQLRSQYWTSLEWQGVLQVLENHPETPFILCSSRRADRFLFARAYKKASLVQSQKYFGESCG